MRDQIEEKLNRIWLAALLESDLTSLELKQVANLLTSSPTFLWNFADLLGDVSRKISRKVESETSLKPNGVMDLDYVHSLVRSKRLSKKRLWEIMANINKKISPDILESPNNYHMLVNFFENSSASQFEDLIFKLQGGAGDDPYLAGISKG